MFTLEFGLMADQTKEFILGYIEKTTKIEEKTTEGYTNVTDNYDFIINLGKDNTAPSHREGTSSYQGRSNQTVTLTTKTSPMAAVGASSLGLGFRLRV